MVAYRATNKGGAMLKEKLLLELKEYLKAHSILCYTDIMDKAVFDYCVHASHNIEDYIKRNKNDETFSTLLLKHIDRLGVSDADIYKAAGIDRRHFSKIRNNRDYRPKKQTALSLCLALKLDKQQTDELLELAGYSLSTSETADLIIMFCIEKGIYDLMDVNEALDYFGQKALGVTG